MPSVTQKIRTMALRPWLLGTILASTLAAFPHAANSQAVVVGNGIGALFSTAPRLNIPLGLAIINANPLPTESILHSFQDGSVPNDGLDPWAGLTQALDGNFYGTTPGGGTSGKGTVYKMTPSGQMTTLHAFQDGTVANDGEAPNSLLVQGADGNLYGTTNNFGNPDVAGTVFKITPSGQETILHTFRDGSVPNDGDSPQSVIFGRDGNLYGTTYRGGSAEVGTVFMMTPFGTETILHTFGDGTVADDGVNPWAGLIQGRDGNFYGTTRAGGAADLGTVFKITPTGEMTTLYSFGSIPNDGAYPQSPVVEGPDGCFYGTTTGGGDANLGTVFKVSPTGQEAILHSFMGGIGFGDGSDPFDNFILGSDGNFYGTTGIGGGSLNGGINNSGTLYTITPAGEKTILHWFNDGIVVNDGGGPRGVIQGTDGNLYGVTTVGGNNDYGTVYRLNLSSGATTGIASSVGIASSANPSVWYQPIAFTVTVSGVESNPSPTGYVTATLTDSHGLTLPLGTFPLDIDGSAQIPWAGGAEGYRSGIWTLTVNYSGNSTYLASTGTSTQVIDKAHTMTYIWTDNATPNVGDTINLGAFVAEVDPSTVGPGDNHIVQFYDGTTLLGSSLTMWGWGFASLPVSNLTPGTHSITATFVGGNNRFSSTSDAVTVSVGDTPPSTTATLAGTALTTGVYSSAVQATLTATASTNPVASTYYTVDGRTQQTYTGAPINITASGNHTVTYWSVDSVGVTEPAKAVSFLIDMTAPTTDIGTEGQGGNRGWNVSPVTVTLTASDDLSGIASTRYTINGGPEQVYTSPVVLSQEGMTQFTGWSTDVAGNVEAHHSIDLYIDAVPPVTTARQAVVSGLPTVTLVVTDDASGVVDSTYYTIDEGAQQTYSAPFALPAAGTHTVKYWSVDQAGNIEDTKSTLVTVPVQLALVSVSPAKVLGAGTTTVTITLNGAAPVGGTVVNLTSSVPSAASFAGASVTVPQGATTARVAIASHNVSLSTNVTITAKAGVSHTTHLTVLPITIASMLISPVQVAGTKSATGTVKLTAPALSDTTISIIVDDPAARVVGPVVVPAGATTTTFLVTTTAVSIPTDVNFTAVVGGVAKATSLQIVPPRIGSAVFTPATASRGATVKLTVKLATIAPTGGATISLIYPNSAEFVNPPTSIKVTAGNKTGTAKLTLASSPPTDTYTTFVYATVNGSTLMARLTISP